MGICMFNQISEAENDVDIKNTFAIEEVSDLLLQTGYRKPIELLALADKNVVITALLDYHVMLKVKGAMDQYKAGLETLGLLDKIQNDPLHWEPVFTKPSRKLTPGINLIIIIMHHESWLYALNFADDLLSMFVIRYAEKGSNERPSEEQTYIHFTDFLDQCYGMSCSYKPFASVYPL